MILASLVVITSCRSTVKTAPIADLVPEGTASFALDPLPVPRVSELTSFAARIGELRVEGAKEGEPAAGVLEGLASVSAEGGAPCRIRLRDLAGGPPEAFVLETAVRGRAVEVDLLGADPAGRRWAAETLRQLILCRAGSRYLRLGRIEDSPGFPLRGSKRPLDWEVAYRANLDYEARASAGEAGTRREHVVAVLSPGGRLDATETGIAAAEEFFRRWHERGARRFAIEFDDVAFGMTPETRDRFGWYPAAISSFLAACRERLREIDPAAILYWLPQTYWTDHPRFRDFARDVRLSGGLPRDLALVLTGPEILSSVISTAGMSEARRRFGATARKILIYDNLGREGDHGPLTGRDGDLATVADGVFGERGEVLNRITRLDYSWNPAAYDPVRSHLLACREVVGAAAASPLSRMIRESRGRPALETLHLYREVQRRLAPPDRAPTGARGLLPRIWRSLADPPKTGIVDTHSRTP